MFIPKVMRCSKLKIIAHYLPQYYPTPENDKWWGKGFTEWTNVGRARPLFKGHDQPKVPADLGYYDLRLPEVRDLQAALAAEAGVDAFCYWHYWFGSGVRLLERPLNEVLRTKKPDFPFCLGWANHTWYSKTWTRDKWYSKRVLMEQTYPGPGDEEAHFKAVVGAFMDPRYFRVQGKPLFLIHAPLDMPNANEFMERWRGLAAKDGLPGIFFVAQASSLAECETMGRLNFDAINLSLHQIPFGGAATSLIARIRRYTKAFATRMPNAVYYADAIRCFYDPVMNNANVFPTLIPNFDHTPRSGILGRVYHNSTPELFGQHAETILRCVARKQSDFQIVFLKSWNEWGEGNYMEPDLRWGKAYIEKLAEVKSRYA